MEQDTRCSCTLSPTDLRFIVSRGAIDIKVLKDLRHGEGQALALRAMRRLPIFYRSAGACPPQSADRNEKRPQPRDHGRLLSRPTHGEGQALALRFAVGAL